MSLPLKILQHALGVDQYGQGRQYRNHFVTGPGCDDWEACQAHFAAGRMNRHPPSLLTGGDYCFVVTESGRAFVAEQSPKPPKLTRSQQRYRDWLAEDGHLRFGDWLKMRGAA